MAALWLVGGPDLRRGRFSLSIAGQGSGERDVAVSRPAAVNHVRLAARLAGDSARRRLAPLAYRPPRVRSGEPIQCAPFRCCSFTHRRTGRLPSSRDGAQREVCAGGGRNGHAVAA